MAGGTGFQEKHFVARIGRQAVRDHGSGGSGADNDVVVEWR